MLTELAVTESMWKMLRRKIACEEDAKECFDPNENHVAFRQYLNGLRFQTLGTWLGKRMIKRTSKKLNWKTPFKENVTEMLKLS